MLGSGIERSWRDRVRRRAPLIGIGGKQNGGAKTDEGERNQESACRDR
jgi:hypothetical protein